jgi:hypothetical protein
MLISLLKLSALVLVLSGCYVVAWNEDVKIDHDTQTKSGLIVIHDEQTETQTHKKKAAQK